MTSSDRSAAAGADPNDRPVDLVESSTGTTDPPGPDAATAERAPEEPRESLVVLVSFCRFAEAIAAGMLVPILPTFIASFPSGEPGPIVSWLQTHASFLLKILPVLAADSPEACTALVFCLAGFAMSLSQIASGRLSDRFDRRKPFIIFGMLGAAACSAAFAFAGGFPDILGTRLVQTAFLGLTFPPMMAIVARHSAPGRGGRMLGLYSTIRLSGFAIGPILGGEVSTRIAQEFAYFGPTLPTHLGHAVTFIVSSALLTISIGLVALLVPDPRETLTPRHERGPRPPVPFRLRILVVSTFLMMVGISAMISLFPTYEEKWGATERQLGYVFGAFLLSRMLLQYASGWLGDRFDKKWVLIASIFLLAPLVTLQGYADSVEQMILLRLGLGVASAALSASIGGMSAERSEPGNRARVMGLNTLSFTLGVSIGPAARWAVEVAAAPCSPETCATTPNSRS